MRRTLLLLIGLLVFSACRKVDGVPFTSYPLPYLPVYPGSSWIYINQNNDTVAKFCEPWYILDSYEVSPWTGSDEMSDKLYVPKYDGMLMYGYDRRVGISLHSDRRFWKLLSDDPSKVSYSWEVRTLHNNIYLKRKLESVDTTVVLNGITYYPCVVIKEYVVPSYTLDDWSRSIYAKDVGLVRKEIFNSDDSLIGFIDLIDYYINK